MPLGGWAQAGWDQADGSALSYSPSIQNRDSKPGGNEWIPMLELEENANNRLEKDSDMMGLSSVPRVANEVGSCHLRLFAYFPAGFP